MAVITGDSSNLRQTGTREPLKSAAAGRKRRQQHDACVCVCMLAGLIFGTKGLLQKLDGSHFFHIGYGKL